MKEIHPEEKIILAIDGLNIYEAKKLLEGCPEIKWVKVGLELFTRNGPIVIKILKEMNKKIFLDLKFHDIPNTMASACYQVAKLGVDIISIHASAGTKALSISKKETLKAAKEMDLSPPLLVGITVLTSFSIEDYQKELDRKNSIEDNVLRLAKLAFDSGLDGCVCSPWEVKNLRSIYKNDFQLITPGIRLEKQNKDDQNRIMSPREAVFSGASKLVIGRSITKARSPKDAFMKICRSID